VRKINNGGRETPGRSNFRRGCYDVQLLRGPRGGCLRLPRAVVTRRVTPARLGALGGRPGARGGRPGALGGRLGALGGRLGALGGRLGALGGRPVPAVAAPIAHREGGLRAPAAPADCTRCDARRGCPFSSPVNGRRIAAPFLERAAPGCHGAVAVAVLVAIAVRDVALGNTLEVIRQ